jgi:hypothetical protein
MDCDFYARSLSGELRDSTVETMLTNNTVIEIHDRVDMERAVIREEGHHFDALAGSFIQDC